MRIIVAYSGGKDSQASLLWAVNKYGTDKIEAVFCDTNWEHPDTYRHIQDTTTELKVKLTILKSKKYDGLVDMSIKKKRFPSSKARFCTEELKVKPMIDYILDQVQDHFIIIQGIRKDESESRSKMSEQCTYFKYYYEPFKMDKEGKPVYHTYRSKDVRAFVVSYCNDVFRPVFNWTANEVINYILENNQKPNPLYYLGMSRVGCGPCVMCTKNEVKIIAENIPVLKNRLLAAEEKINELGQRSNFFGPGYIPAKFCKKTFVKDKKVRNKKTGVIRIKKTIVGIPTAQEVFTYVTRFASQKELEFDDNKGRSCMSAFNICE